MSEVGENLNPFHLISDERLAELAIEAQTRIAAEKIKMELIAGELGRRATNRTFEEIAAPLAEEEPAFEAAAALDDAPEATQLTKDDTSDQTPVDMVDDDEPFEATELTATTPSGEIAITDSDTLFLLNLLRKHPGRQWLAKDLYAAGFAATRRGPSAPQQALSKISRSLEEQGIITRNKPIVRDSKAAKALVYAIADGVTFENTPLVLADRVQESDPQTSADAEQDQTPIETMTLLPDGVLVVGTLRFRLKEREQEFITILATQPGRFFSRAEMSELGYHAYGPNNGARLNSITYYWNGMNRELRKKLETKIENRKVYYRLLNNYQLIDLRNVAPPEVPVEEIAVPSPEAEPVAVEEMVLPPEAEPVHDEETTLPPEPEPAPEPPKIEIVETPERQQESAKEIAKNPTEKLLEIGNTVVFDREFHDPIRQQRIIRLQNISELNQMTREITKRFKRVPRSLLIERDGRLHLDGEELESGPFMTDLWNTLLLGYLSKPFTPVEAHNKYGFAYNHKNGELQRLLGKLHVKATELKFRNIIYYDQDQKSGMSLKPVIIVDRRQ